MPRTRPAETTDSLSPAVPPGPGLGWALFGGLALVGFCFGVWAGTQKPERVAQAPTPATAKDDPTPPKPEPVKADAPAETKSAPAVLEPDKPAAKKEPARPPGAKPAADPKPPAKPAEAMEADPKPPEPKKPEPKKPEPKKVDPKPSAPAPTFAKDIAPVFRSHCQNCHGGVGSPKGGLDLRTLAAAVKGGDGGPGVKPGEPDASPVWVSIADDSMPPAGKPRLTEKEKKLVREWIAGGAK